MLRPDINEVIDGSEVLVIGLSGADVSDALATRCRADQVLLDVVKLPNRSVIRAHVEGLCW